MISLGGRRVVGFGVGAWYDTSGSDELAALIKMSDDRMQNLSDAFQAFGPKWLSTDPAAYGDFVADYGLLQGRYAQAKLAASGATGFWSSVQDVRNAYDAISKSFRQNYQPSTSVVSPTDATVSDVKGDWADLWKRIAAAQKSAGAPVIVDHPSPELANLQTNSLAMQFYRATAPIDIGAQLFGGQAPGDTVKWLKEHKIPIAIGATIVVGGILYAVVRR